MSIHGHTPTRSPSSPSLQSHIPTRSKRKLPHEEVPCAANEAMRNNSAQLQRRYSALLLGMSLWWRKTQLSRNMPTIMEKALR